MNEFQRDMLKFVTTVVGTLMAVGFCFALVSL